MELSTKQLSIGYNTKNLLLRDFSESFQSGNFIGVIGRNGSGKSTFLRHLTGLSIPLSGEILIEGINIRQLSTQQLAKKISWIGTGRFDYLYLSVEELVALGRHPHLGLGGFLNSNDREIVNKALETTGIQNLRHRAVGQCSDGEKQSAMLARAIAQDTPIVLLDEITAHLDYVHRHKSFEFLSRLAKENNKLIMLATHEIDLALRYCDELLVLNNGQFQKILKKDFEDRSLLNEIFEGFLG